ncbi:DUF2974 domain-containing protein (plasmid) [Vibrio cholerae]|uniref:lipase family protein n=1 Tax=Vibrio cholerae TaxID=666 RepID=UPI0015815670|nr:DUF2974 domain-containing protein [Vibrio cholerae]EJL6462612.1 DUF2974 domain-containing protein [Vibrio cholerae]MBJ6954127.1 DUF2974 domain-containing protein [Vibrio cholerae]QKU73196.1 DUF2974 domain-containing protein [Vibrio cholerae]QKU77186.1 DUF2974 domain-containing protein [Vibrio cholerae]HDZ9329292.1 DUF2974 domain-containing protein [Vibrio cholerae]
MPLNFGGLYTIFVGSAPKVSTSLDCNSEDGLTNTAVVDIESNLKTYQTYASLSNGIYDSRPDHYAAVLNKFCSDSGVSCEVEEKSSGLRSLTAIDGSDPDNQKITIVFRGTGDDTDSGISANDVSTDVGQHLGMRTPMYDDAINLVRDVKAQYPDAKITTTGHSLGGALANVSALKNNTDAVLFSPATLKMSSPTTYQGAVFVLPGRALCLGSCNHKISELQSRLEKISKDMNPRRKLCEIYKGKSRLKIE